MKFPHFSKILSFVLAASIMQSGMAATTSDSTITRYVKEKFHQEQTLSGFAIGVQSHEGVVTLSGKVDTTDEATKAIELAQSVQGVNDVDAAGLTVKSSTQPMTDTAITAKIKGMFLREKLFGENNPSLMGITVTTTNGVVYLGGKADTRQQADNAAKIAKSVSGVTDVKSTIETGSSS